MEEKISQNGTTDDGQDKKSAKKAAKHDGGVADLERVTDYAEEKELSSADISNVSLMALPIVVASFQPQFRWASGFDLMIILQHLFLRRQSTFLVTNGTKRLPKNWPKNRNYRKST